MLNAASLTGKMNMLPDPVTLTITPKVSSGSPIVQPGCRRRPLDEVETDYIGDIGLAVPAVSFLIPVEGLNGYVINNNDYIAETLPAGSTWTVIRTQLDLQKTIWRCLCRRQF